MEDGAAGFAGSKQSEIRGWERVRSRGGVEASEGAMLGCWRERWSMDTDVSGLPLGPDTGVAIVGIGPSAGESKGRIEAMLSRFDFRGEVLRAMLLRGVEPLAESKLPCESSCRQFMMRSFGGCVAVLSRLDFPIESILFERPTMEPARFEKTEAASQLSVSRFLFVCAQS